jgi:hypothetical protein
LRTWLNLHLARPVAIDTRKSQDGTVKKSLHRPRLSAIILRFRPPALIQIAAPFSSRLSRYKRRIRHPILRWMGATLDGRVQDGEAVFEAKFMLPWSFSEEAAVQKYMPQLQHNMWVVTARSAVLSVITGGGKWVEITTHADPLYQHLIVTAERKFWRCVESGEPPTLFGVDPPKPRIEALRIVDMSTSNAWAEFAGIFMRTREAHLEHEKAKTELKSLLPEDAQQAIGHGIRAKRSKSGAISFDLLKDGGESHAAV